MNRLIHSLKSNLSTLTIPVDVKAIYLYGSMVSGRIRKDSDLDVAILLSHKLNHFRRLELISKIESIFTSCLVESGLKQEVSVLDLRGKYVSFQLQYRVLTEGILVFERDPSQRLEFENAVKREYFDFLPFLKFLRKAKYGNLSQKV